MEQKTITLEMLMSSLRKKEPETVNYHCFHVAALSAQYQPDTLKEEVSTLFDDYQMSEEDMDLLLQASVESHQPDQYILKDSERIKVLNWLAEHRKLPKLIQKLRPGLQDPLEKMLLDYLEGNGPALSSQNLDELAISYKISGWLGKTKITVPAQAEIQAYIKRRETLQPFYQLTTGFKGRTEALQYLNDYVNSKPPAGFKSPLLIHGIGGIGKSTLIAKFILNHLENDQELKLPFIFIDFDKPGYTIAEPLRLAIDGLRQLETQFPQAKPILNDIKLDINTYLDRSSRPAQKNVNSNISTRVNFYDSIARRYVKQYQTQLDQLKTPILVVLDSFEEAQFRGKFSELNNLFNFLKEIGLLLPQICILIAGRDDLIGSDVKVERYPLGEFDQVAAESFLEAGGVQNPQLRAQIAEHIGGNPLLLKLATNHVLQSVNQQDNTPPDYETLFRDLNQKNRQEFLVRRNLMHIKSDDAQKIAFPGMLVRKISPEIIQNVLAVPCGLGEISLQKAKTIFEDLKNESFLLSDEQGELVFRKDLRVALYDLILEEYKEKAVQIRDRAIEFYADKPLPADQAEYLYHRLKRADDPVIIETIYKPELRSYMENAMSELPLNALVHLSRIMGITVSDATLAQSKLSEWENYMCAQIIDILEDGDESGLKRKKGMLQVRSLRSNTSGLYAYEAKVHLRLGEFDAAQKVLDAAKPHKKDLMPFILLCSDMDEYRLDFKSALETLLSVDFEKDIQCALVNSVEHLCSLLRNAARMNVRVEKQTTSALDYMHSLITQLPEPDKDTRLNALRAALPRFYQPFAASVFPDAAAIQSPGALLPRFQSLARNTLPAEDCRRLYRDIREIATGNESLEQKMFNHFKLSVTNISEPGTNEICTYDVLNFLEQKFEQDINQINRIFLDKAETASQATPLDQPKFDKNAIKELIAAGKTEAALASLRAAPPNDQIMNDVILLLGQFNQLKRAFNSGTISTSDQSLTLARINYALLQILDEA